MREPAVEPFDSRYVDFLRDESRLIGRADSISFPGTEREIREIVASMNQTATPVTVQGARTGITAGAVPEGGHVLNLGRMNGIPGLRRDVSTGRFCVRVQPGVLLSSLQKILDENSFDTQGWASDSCETLEQLRAGGPSFFSPDPTETGASIGGMVACNASGARSFQYGSTANHVCGLRLVLADGSTMSLKRGQCFADGRHFELRTEDNTRIDGFLPSYVVPPVKCTAGYRAFDGMDMVDLFVGMEGTLGIITEIELGLLPRPPVIWGVIGFLPSEENALKFTRFLRGEPVDGLQTMAVNRPVAIEFFNHSALSLLRRVIGENKAFADIPEPQPRAHTAIYFEYHGETEDDVVNSVVSASDALVALGGREEDTWVADNRKEMKKLRDFRHAVPEAVNLVIDERRRSVASLTKLGTDMSVPAERLCDVMAMYNRDLETGGLENVIFGHAGSSHLHVNIMPRTLDEYNAGKELYREWARAVVAMGGSVSAEHGVGKLKREFLRIMYGDKGIDEMRELKKKFDPRNILNTGNLFGREEGGCG